MKLHHKADICYPDAVFAPRRVGSSLTSVICYLKWERGKGDMDPELVGLLLDCLWTRKWDGGEGLYLFHI